MRAEIIRERIRVIPVPKENGYKLWIWLRKPLNKGNKPYVYADIEKGQKWYTLPCPLDNIQGVVIKRDGDK